MLKEVFYIQKIRNKMDFVEVAKKRQKFWQNNQTYKTLEDSNKKSFYILDMFPYPSGAGLHVWHPKWYIATDVIARKHILQWQNVLHPMGFDTFGLPTEQFAIANKIKPQIAANQNIETYKKQLEMFGCTYDWDRAVNTADPEFFKWTQWTVLQLYHHYYDQKVDKAMPISDLEQKITSWEIVIPDGLSQNEFIDKHRLIYLDYKPINRCPSCKTGLANEDLEDGKCERCGSEVEQKPMRQWVVRITEYAERLLSWLEQLPNWSESAIEQQKNWIGKSEWSQFKMYIMPENDGRISENDGRTKKLSKENNDGTYDIIGLAMKVHRELWPGLQEKVYVKWLTKLLKKAGYEVSLEKKIAYKIDGEMIAYGFVDILVNGNIALELKSRKNLLGDYYKQLRTYINQSEDISCGLLLNFYNGKLEYKRLEKEYNTTLNNQKILRNSQTILSDFQDILRNSQENSQKFFSVFTTRLDTVFGMTFVVMSPEHSLVDQITTDEYKVAVEKYKEQARHKTQLERTELQKEKTGQFTGAYAVNPFNGQEVPIYIWDYVLANYWTGVVMAVPAHDERDFEFAKKYDVLVTQSIEPLDKNNPDFGDIADSKVCYIEKWILVNSGEFSGMSSDEAILAMQERLEKNWIWGKKTNYKIQDWVFSRQRYWGEPFPFVFCEQCWTVPLNESDLPLELPDVEHYEPTGTEEWPLADIDFWINTKCPRCWWKAKRESNTMPGRAGSSWYWLRYMDPHNSKELVSPEKEKFWHPVDIYVWWAEHITRHMIYARFWHKFLQDLWIVSVVEPFKKYQHVWLIMAEDGRKMSKRWWNVINPDGIINEFGPDVLRVYEMFMWPFDQAVNWNTSGVKWVKKFLDRLIGLSTKVDKDKVEDKKTLNTLHKTIKKVWEDIDVFAFNTAISQLMIIVNELSEQEQISQSTYENLIVLLAPFAPHIAEELWQKFWNSDSLFTQDLWPIFDSNHLALDTITLAIQINGKLRWTINISPNATQDEAMSEISKNEKIQNYLWWEIIKIIYIPWKICNIVVKN